MEINNRLDSDTCTNGRESAGVDGSLHADHLDDVDMHGEGNSQELADGCLDPIRSDNILLTGSTQDDQVINSNQSLDLPDPGSQAVVSRSPSPEPPLDSNSPSGPDIEELCGIVEDEDLALYLGFIKLLRNASLDDAGMQMEEEDLERLQNPPRYGINLESEPDLRLALDLFLANYTSSVDTYNQNRKAMLRRHPEDNIYTYDQAKHLVQHLSGIVPLAHDMCINTCIAYTGPFSDLEICPYCNTPRYNPAVLGKSSEKKTAQRVFHTMPIGPQLQAFYRSRESAEKMKYAEKKLQEIVDEALNAEGTQPDFEDWCHGADFLQAFHEGHIKKGDPILMFSIDGAQLYRSKASDCWMYIWVIFNLDPATGRYKKAAVLFGGIIPGPNKPKIVESFLFPGLHHLSAIQKEGLPIWDASTNTFYVSNPYMALASADGPAMAYINGLVGHQGKVGCRLYCPMKGRLKGSHYYPVCLKPESADETSNHPDVQPAEYAHKTFFNYENQLKYVTESPNKTQYKNRRLETGIVKPGIFLGLQPKHTHTIPRCFGYDIMHLISLNIPDLLLSLWRGTIETSDRNDRISWDFAVLQGPVWKNHGADVASMTPYLPGSFDRPPRNPAEKINSGYKAWEYLMYIYGLGPGLFYHILPKPYWRNLCRLVRGIRIAHQYKIPMTSLKQAHQFLLDFILEFEDLYYKRHRNRMHFVRPCIHLLIHIAPEVLCAGPGIIGSQWVMERALGDVGSEISLPSNPFANLSQRAVLRCQVNALKAILPELDEPKNLLPRGTLDLHGGYVLLRARDPSPSHMTDSAVVALRSYYEGQGQPLTDSGTSYRVIRWARLRIPTGQIARSAWKEKLKSASNVRMARNVKLKASSIALAFSVPKC